MTAPARPNKDALSAAIDIYRDAMRPFMLRCLRRVSGATVEVAIKRSLQPRQADEFEKRFRESNDLASSLDVNYFPLLVQRNWRDVFSTEFRDDRTIQNKLWLINEARNETAHPGTQDLETEYAGRIYT